MSIADLVAELETTLDPEQAEKALLWFITDARLITRSRQGAA
ncbi:MAG: hypothetical protein R2706_21110 [Acidimicrobiales bacterium]